MMTRPHVKAAIDEAQKTIADTAQVDGEWITKKLIAMVEDPNTNDHARAKALDQLAKIRGMYVERHQHEHGRAGEFARMDDQQLEAEIQRLSHEPELEAIAHEPHDDDA